MAEESNQIGNSRESSLTFLLINNNGMSCFLKLKDQIIQLTICVFIYSMYLGGRYAIKGTNYRYEWKQSELCWITGEW